MRKIFQAAQLKGQEPSESFCCCFWFFHLFRIINLVEKSLFFTIFDHFYFLKIDPFVGSVKVQFGRYQRNIFQ